MHGKKPVLTKEGQNYKCNTLLAATNNSYFHRALENGWAKPTHPKKEIKFNDSTFSIAKYCTLSVVSRSFKAYALRAIVRNLRGLIIEKTYNYTTTQRHFWLFRVPQIHYKGSLKKPLYQFLVYFVVVELQNQQYKKIYLSHRQLHKVRNEF